MNAPLHLSELLTNFATTDVVLVDCLTLWLNNWIFELGDECSHEKLEAEIEKLIKMVRGSDATLIFVSNEVGMGIVPLGGG